MRIRSDFDQIVHVTPDQHAWIPSPLPGVARVMLDRIGGERAVATSLVRYAAGAGYSPHEHGGGEEFIVLDGEIADEQSRYPPLTYVRNPPGSAHRPYSDPGCTLFVKLRQFHPDDQRHCVLPIGERCPADGWQTERPHEHRGEQAVNRAGRGQRQRAPASQPLLPRTSCAARPHHLADRTDPNPGAAKLVPLGAGASAAGGLPGAEPAVRKDPSALRQ